MAYKTPKYEFILPLERGDGTEVLRGHYGDCQTQFMLRGGGIADPDHLFESC